MTFIAFGNPDQYDDPASDDLPVTGSADVETQTAPEKEN